MMAKAGLLFVGTDDGAVLFSNPNNIGRWLRIGQPLRGHTVRSLWPLPDNPLVVFAAVEGKGLQQSDDGGQSWRVALDLEASSVVGHHNSVNLVYAYGVNGDLYRSTDAGEQWQPQASDERPVGGGRLVVAPEDARRLYLGLTDGVWTSADDAPSWTRYGQGLTGPVQGLAAAPGRPGLLYAIASGGLYACAGAARRWERLAAAPQPAADALAVLAGKDPTLLLVQAAGAIGRSDDDGATWATVGADVDWGGELTIIQPASYHMDTAFAGSLGGRLASSTDRGRTWQMLKQDLPPVRSIAAARLA
jgi:photosystem II stability/assembly factor-like uncharacterized protein